jgi:hypothetical protein
MEMPTSKAFEWCHIYHRPINSYYLVAQTFNDSPFSEDLNVFNMEEYAAVWRPELLYTNKEVNLLSHEVNMEARLIVVRNETAVYR